jgi:hypothetical protein
MIFVVTCVKLPMIEPVAEGAERMFRTSPGPTPMTAYGPEIGPGWMPLGVAVAALPPLPLVAVGAVPVDVGAPGVTVGRLRVAVAWTGVSVTWRIVGDGRTGKVGMGVGVPINESEQAVIEKTIPTARSRTSIRFISGLFLSIFISPL